MYMWYRETEKERSSKGREKSRGCSVKQMNVMRVARSITSQHAVCCFPGCNH